MILRRLTIVAILAAACGSPPPRHHAAGTLIMNGLADEDRAGWATELEILRSRALVDDVVRELAAHGVTVDGETLRRGVTARRVKDSRVIEVAVALPDRPLAIDACNTLMQRYFSRHREGLLAPQLAQRDALSAELDRLRAQLAASDAGEDPAVLAQYERTLGRLQALELSAAAPANDVLLLDACRWQ
jgi:uncharacterized protein involved in exopolysaccharide biosynthesis